MSFFRNLFGKKQAGKQTTSKKSTKKLSSDGYLLPEHWQCIICKAHLQDQQAVYAMRANIFLMTIDDNDSYLELAQEERLAAKNYAKYMTSNVGSVPKPANAEHFEDTSGLARDRTGMGFDAIFLCDEHAQEMHKAIDNLAKKNK